MVGRLAGKSAIITGAGSGFGEGMAKRFAEEDCCVLVTDLNEKAATRVADDIGPTAVPMKVDVSRKDDIEAMVARGISEFETVDILVNNAGFSHRNGSLLDVDEDQFDLITNVNMKAIYHATQMIVPHMRDHGGGSILTTASTAGLRPRPGLTWYNASKGWTVTATKSMAVELAPHNIRVNCLCPVAGETGMLATFMGEDTPEIRERFKSVIPLGRFSTPMDIANAALWLVSDEANFITGVALEVDGGRCV
ncbi:MAG: SDR family oxidoreductase [Pseudomonadota bacterium]